MKPRERLLAVLHGEIPDCVPACPDISNMIPARLTGKPFWDIYVHQDPTLWKAYIDAARYFDIDAGFELYDFSDLFGDEAPRERRIVPMSFRRINVSRLLVFTRAQAICSTFPKDIGRMCPGWHPRCAIARRVYPERSRRDTIHHAPNQVIF